MAIIGLPIFAYLLFGAYALFNIVNIVLASINYKFKLYNLLLPFVLFVLHFSYGIGTVIGIIKISFFKRI